jgi:Uncharacterized conserved protein
MLDFRPLELRDIPLLRPILDNKKERICDDTVGGVFLWRDYFHIDFALEGGNLFLRAKMPDSGQTVFSIPMGKDPARGLDVLEEHCRQSGESLCYTTVPEPALEILRARWPKIKIEEEADWADYLYNYDDLKDLPGGKYAGKRNHVSRFMREYEDWQFEPINESSMPAVRAFFSRFIGDNMKDSDTFWEDERKVAEVLDHYQEYGFCGGALWVGGQVVGMAMGEIRDDTLFVHIEKADTDYHGAYQMLVTHLPRLYARPGLLYINREDDAGDEGLRRSKQSYYPVSMLKKFKVCRDCSGK